MFQLLSLPLQKSFRFLPIPLPANPTEYSYKYSCHFWQINRLTVFRLWDIMSNLGTVFPPVAYCLRAARLQLQHPYHIPFWESLSASFGSYDCDDGFNSSHTFTLLLASCSLTALMLAVQPSPYGSGLPAMGRDRSGSLHTRKFLFSHGSVDATGRTVGLIP